MIIHKSQGIASAQFAAHQPRAGESVTLDRRALRPMPGVRWATGSWRRGAFLMTEVVIAMAILILAVFPVSYAVWHERQLSRACYFRAVAMEIVDGEMDVLAAGVGRTLAEGSHPYSVSAESATNLPPGRFVVTRTGKQLRLEWHPEERDKGGSVSREAALP